MTLGEVYRAGSIAECEERAFMLTAVGIPSQIMWDGGEFVLYVDETLAEQARTELALYQWEIRRPATEPVLPRTPKHPRAWAGSALYSAVLLAVTYMILSGLGRLDAFDLGELTAEGISRGEWWRAITALTLHRDAAHLLANLGFGAWFGYLAGQRLGPGVAWLAILLASALSNWLEATLAPIGYRSVGASTAVFAALGLMAAFSWRERLGLRQRWALRWGPLVAGVILLGWTGAQGEHTDVVAHVLGFAFGALLGILAALPRSRRLIEVAPQWMAGLAALGAVIIAWTAVLLA